MAAPDDVWMLNLKDKMVSEGVEGAGLRGRRSHLECGLKEEMEGKKSLVKPLHFPQMPVHICRQKINIWGRGRGLFAINVAVSR